MSSHEITMVRVYLHEAEGRLEELLKRLREVEQVRGVTVFRGISGFGDSGKLHSAGLLDLALDLPLVLEFFDEHDKVARILEHLDDILPAGHVVQWPARVND